MSGRIVVVLGASGTIGCGFIKACLDSNQPGWKVVGVFRSDKSIETTRALLGNPSEDVFIPVIESEENGRELLKVIETKAAGEITDVIASIGAWGNSDPVLQQSYEALEDIVMTKKLKPHFICAKVFIEYLRDRPNTTYTVINGGAANFVIPGAGNLTIGNGVLNKLFKVIFSEYKEKSVRINEFMICCLVTSWTDVKPQSVSNIDMGRALLGVLIHPAARCLPMLVNPDNMETIAKTGITDALCP